MVCHHWNSLLLDAITGTVDYVFLMHAQVVARRIITRKDARGSDFPTFQRVHHIIISTFEIWIVVLTSLAINAPSNAEAEIATSYSAAELIAIVLYAIVANLGPLVNVIRRTNP